MRPDREAHRGQIGTKGEYFILQVQYS